MIGKTLGQRALWARAIDYVHEYKPTLIGITGSYGKTLTKEAVRLALQDARHIRASHKSYNTPIGIALSILGQRAAANRKGWIGLLAGSKIREINEPEPDTIVLEVGANHPGDIDWVVGQLPFTVGVITNAGSTHLEYFQTKEMVAHEYMSLPISLPEKGTAILNIDDPLVAEMAYHIKQADILTYGKNKQADIRLTRLQRRGVVGFVAEVAISGRIYELSLPHIAAEYQVHSDLAAIAVAASLLRPAGKGSQDSQLKKSITNLSQLKAPPGRMQLRSGKNGATIIDDSFNAAPESMAAALTTLKKMPGRRRIAILGDMLNIGGSSFRRHTEIGEQAAAVADVFIAVGPAMKHAQAAALESGHEVDTHHFPDSRDVGKWLEQYLQPGDTVLIKGSRDMRMDRATRRLTT